MVERLHIREETADDQAKIHQLNKHCFADDTEARLIDRLRDADCEYLSLVATLNDDIVGHILFTSVQLENTPSLNIMGLAPLCVSQQHQRHGIGGQLVNAGLDRCRAMGGDAVVVLGYTDFYLRFGFRPASQFGLTCAYDVPDELFMALVFNAENMEGHSGLIHYHPAFEEK